MSRRVRALSARLILLLLGLGLGLAAAEVAVRVLRPQAVAIAPLGMYEPDPPGRYRLRAGYRGVLTNRTEYTTGVAVNSAGLRSPELPAANDGAVRVLTVGDSFTFGQGVEEPEAFGERLAARLGASGTPARVLNAGTPGFSLVDDVSWLERHAAPLEPDLVVLGVYVGNDVQDSDPQAPGIELKDGMVFGQGSRHGLAEWLYYHSHLFALAKASVHGPAERRVRRWLGLPEPFATRNLRSEAAIYARTPPPALVRGRVACDAALGRLEAFVRARRIPVVALLIPHVVQVNPARFAAALSDLGLDPAGFDPEAPSRLVLDLLAAHGIPAVDAAPALAQRIAAGEKMYYPIDRHWTAAAHDLAAGLLAERLPGIVVVPPHHRPWTAGTVARESTP